MDEPYVFENNTEEAVRLDRFLLEELAQHPDAPEVTRSQLQRWIKFSGVTINGKDVRKSGVPVKPGARVTFLPQYPDEKPLEPYELPLEVIFEDESLIVLNKPAGLAVHPGAGNSDKTLLNALVARLAVRPDVFESSDRPGIVHRLDKDTTGLLVVAKHTAALAKLSGQFAARTVGREYLALVLSTPRGKRVFDQEDSGVIRTRIGRHTKDRVRMAVVEQGGREAETHWRVFERMDHGVLVSLRLKTGRTHQIRVHMEHVGASVIGDPLYGGDEVLPRDLQTAAKDFGRQALHARELAFDHPTTGERLEFRVAIPEDFQHLLAKFGGSGDDND